MTTTTPEFKFNTPLETLFSEAVKRFNYKGFTWYTDGIVLVRADLFDPQRNKNAFTSEGLSSIPAETANYLSLGFDDSQKKSVLFKGVSIGSFDAYHIWGDFSPERLTQCEVALLGQKYRDFLWECEVQVIKQHHPSDPVLLYTDSAEPTFAGILAPGHYDFDEWLQQEEKRKLIMQTYQEYKDKRQRRVVISKNSKQLVYTGEEQ